MPNWCYNKVSFAGSNENLKKLFEAPFYFDRFVHIPAHEVSEIVQFANGQQFGAFKPGGYERCTQEWGTKWDIDPIEVQVPDGHESVEINFDTAWSPPIPVLQAVAKANPELTITLYVEEEGHHFHGQVIFKGENALSEIVDGPSAAQKAQRELEDAEND